MKIANPSEFLFRGNAVAAGGFLTKLDGKPVPLDPQVITTHGESRLPFSGGVSHSLIEQPVLAFPKWINYGACETFAWARHSGTTAMTTLRASVSNVRLTTGPSPEDQVPNVESISFLAQRFFIEVESVHPQKGEPSFQVKTAEATGLSLAITDVAGKVTTTPIELVLDQAVIGLRTMKDLDREFRKNRQFFDEHVSCFHTNRELAFGKSKVPRTSQGYVIGSIVKQIKLGDEVIQGNVLTRPGFGKISFGVLVADGYSRRIAMALVTMGSDPGADATLTCVETNGIWK